MEKLIKNIGLIRNLLTATLLFSVFLWLMTILWIGGIFTSSTQVSSSASTDERSKKTARLTWHAPSLMELHDSPTGDSIRYGRELIVNTSQYLGPEGTVGKMGNGMNCQNCHLEAGTKPFGNNFALVASTYPKFRSRSGTLERLDKRVNDCFERSLNGKALDSTSRELKSIVSYITWIGKDVQKGTSPLGTGMSELAYLDRRADPIAGKMHYETKCETCHGTNGQGLKLPGAKSYQFPPLWGPDSYNNGAGLYRLSNFARYVNTNMPLGASFEQTLLAADEAWDIAAYVNSMPRPEKDLSHDWPDISKKPIDHPFGPYADNFSEAQHKYGPFKPIQDFYSKK